MPLDTGTVNASEALGTTEKTTPESSQGTESVASETGTEQAGGEQSTAEGSQAEGQQVRPRGPSKLDTIRELRAKLREQRSVFDSEVGTIRSQLDEMRQMMAQRNGGTKPSKTFWEAPEEVLDERITNHLSEFEKRMLTQIQARQSQDQETTEWKQEASEATKFIQGQQGVTREDHEDIAEIIRGTPSMANMRPLERAEYGLFLWQKQRGVGDKTALKQKAATVVGAPGAGGEKTWTEAEISRTVDDFNKVPVDKWTPEQVQKFDAFEREIRRAQSAGRVK